MIDIKALINARQRNDPSFRTAKEPGTGLFYLRDQIILQYPPGTSLPAMEEFARKFIEDANQHLPAGAKPATVQSISGTGASVSIRAVLLQGPHTDTVAVGTTPPPPNPPPPHWTPIDKRLNYVRPAIVVVDTNTTVMMLVSDFLRIESQLHSGPSDSIRGGISSPSVSQ